jgi:hypothetical protein
MGTPVVVNPQEVIKTLLLLQEVERGRLGRLVLQGQVDTFMTAVLLWVSGLDALYLDAQA